MSFKQQVKLGFTKPSFFLSIGSATIMMLIVVSGNPIISGAFYLHFIPELAANYFIGIWARQAKIRFWMIIVVYLVVTFLTMLLVTYFTVLSLILSAVLGFPMLVGYFLEKIFGEVA